MQLIHYVLSSILIFFMAFFKLPKWVLKRMDQIRRDFLWARAECTQIGISLMCWDSLCMPKQYGGLGIPNLELRNIALLLRWWWKAYEEPETLWAMIATTLKWIGRYVNGPNYWEVRGSFFWNQLIRIKHLFH